MTGRLPEISKWCKFEGNAWSDPQGQGHSGWEELPYWLKGYGDLGYVLGDQEIIKGARKWIDAVLASQQADGWFGPRANKTGLEGKPDLWPHMVMCNVLESFYEYTGDERVLPFLTRYFKWLNTRPGRELWRRLLAQDPVRRQYRDASIGFTITRASPGCWSWPSASMRTCRIGPAGFTTGTT